MGDFTPNVEKLVEHRIAEAIEALATLITGSRLPVDASGVTVDANMAQADREAITGTPSKTLADIVTAISGILKSEMVTAKAAAWEAITTDTEFTPPAGTNGITLAPKATSMGTIVSGTVWGKPSGESEEYRIAGTFSFLCSTATLEADGFTDVMKCIDITGMTDIKVIFTGGELAYLPY
jgi:hypothetical protein